jgi:hypothetical protein
MLCRVVVLDALRQDGARLAYKNAEVVRAPLGADTRHAVRVDEPSGTPRPLGQFGHVGRGRVARTIDVCGGSVCGVAVVVHPASVVTPRTRATKAVMSFSSVVLAENWSVGDITIAATTPMAAKGMARLRSMSESGQPKRAFISYVKEDSDHVDRLCKVLEAGRIPYWRDRKDLGPGDAWKKKIRDAIASDSLVFLACFSDQSRARTVSYMNEELTLAVDAFRLRPPGATWLIPVRFDDGPLPDWELGAGRSINDFNYADLFGDSYAVEATSLVTAINSLIGAPSPDASTTRAAVEEASSEIRPLLMRRMTKEMVPDPTRRIDLDDLIRQEVRHILNGMRDGGPLPANLVDGTADQKGGQIIRSALEAWKLVEPLCNSLQVAARWAEYGALDPWATGIRSIAGAGLKADSGNTALLGLRALPALFLEVTAAVSAVSQRRWDNLRKLVVDVRVATPYASGQPLLQQITPWTPFKDAEWLPNVLVRTSKETLDPEEAFRTRESNTRWRTPTNDWLLALLTPLFEDQFPDDEDFTSAFEYAEVMLGVLSQDLSNQAIAAGGIGDGGSRWYGRATWSDRYSRKDTLGDLEREASSEGRSWGPLEAGLFGADPDRALQAISGYRENFDHVAHKMMFR